MISGKILCPSGWIFKVPTRSDACRVQRWARTVCANRRCINREAAGQLPAQKARLSHAWLMCLATTVTRLLAQSWRRSPCPASRVRGGISSSGCAVCQTTFSPKRHRVSPAVRNLPLCHIGPLILARDHGACADHDAPRFGLPFSACSSSWHLARHIRRRFVPPRISPVRTSLS